ncbi:hypothetical protein JT359_09305 [Candidatus Poribacteria bacterium]|nr:hypothetical protein [Candidatus Poribacteria bacterium]
MRFKDNHIDFVITAFARFMKVPEIIDVFIDTFKDDIEELFGRPYIGKSQYIQEYIAENHNPVDGEDDYYDDLIVNGEDEYYMNACSDDEEIRTNIASRIRRFNITHTQFPKKYRDKFYKARREYYNELHSKSLDNPQNNIEELEALYRMAKKRIIEEDDLHQVPIAHQILKTIITAKKVLNEKEKAEEKLSQQKSLSKPQEAISE